LIDGDLLDDDPAALVALCGSASSTTRLLLMVDFDEQLRAGSALEAGFRGYLTRPVKQSALLDALVPMVDEPGRASPAPRRQQMPAIRPTTILVAEDNPVNQKLALFQLRYLGYQAHAVGNGREAVNAIAAPPPGTTWALILMDCQMPELDGFAATAAIRAAERQTGGHIPIVAMTANAMEGDRETCLHAGMDDYLPKPVNIEQLRQVLERMLLAQPEALPVPLEPAVLEELRTMIGDTAPEFVNELIDLFQSDTPELLAKMRKAIAERDTTALRRTAHSGRGTSANLGANRLSELFGELEQSAKSGITGDAMECLARIDAEYQRVADALEYERSIMRASAQET
jgi:CheY-like chemotaxis protein/HPt (histidine-containing phosphotransfer) domain-containing protein